ncbi:hypothetical protein F5Y13DRAFT_147535 [Hypoxylon sp. FL1857]|nr:hypothetical protein F5Y13DRAFT_147535 [Hypoxylon sp. FL1857]
MGSESDTEQFLPAKEPLRPKNEGFNHYRQAIQLFLKFLGRWLLTAIICAAFAVVLRSYDRKPYIKDHATQIYNTIVAGLTICLSLNIASSLNAFASVFKWVILARRPFRPRVFDLILAFDYSNMNVIRLLFRRERIGWWLRLLCFVWLVVVLAAQVSTALIGLAYSVVPLSPESDQFPMFRGDGVTSLFTYINSYLLAFDNVPVDSGDLLTDPMSTEDFMAFQRSNAFAYGVGAIGSGITDYDSPDAFLFHTTTYDKENETYINTITNYPSGSRDILWNAIGRGVENWARCVAVDASISNLHNSSDTTTITFDGYNGTQAFAIAKAPLDYVTYISDTELSCGPRCTQVYSIVSTNETTDLFICNSTVGWMYDWVDSYWIEQWNLSIPDAQASILAGAIGWGDIEVNSSVSTPGRFQASSFPPRTYWAPASSRPSASTMANWYIAHFTAATIQVINQYGISDNFTNLILPGVASKLNVEWKYSILILSLIPGVQALLAVSCICVLYRYQVPVYNDSPLAMATLLAPVMAHIPTGTLQSGAKMTKDMEHDIVYMPEGDKSSNKVKVSSKEDWSGKKAFRRWS